MVNKYFKAARALIFWMGLYCLICKPVPTTTAFQKRCQIYYKRELEQNSSLAMHRRHYANTTREHISQSISSPLEKPPPNCLSCGEPSPPPPPSPTQRKSTFKSVRHDVRRFHFLVSVSGLGAGRGQNRPRWRWSQPRNPFRAFGKIDAGTSFSPAAGLKEAAAPHAVIGPVMDDCHLPH